MLKKPSFNVRWPPTPKRKLDLSNSLFTTQFPVPKAKICNTRTFMNYKTNLSSVRFLGSSYPFGPCNNKDLEHKFDSLKYSFPAEIKPDVKPPMELLLGHTPTERIKEEAILQRPGIRP